MKITFNTRHLGVQTIDTDDLTPAVLEYVITYGLKQSIDDAGASPDKAQVGSQTRLVNLLAGTVPAGGGLRVSPLTKALRDIVAKQLRSVGHKAGNAMKLAQDPQSGFSLYLGTRLARKYEVPVTDVSETDVATAFSANWAAIVQQAEKIVAAGIIDDIDV